MNRQSKVMAGNFRAAAILGIAVLGAMLLWGFGCSRTNPGASQSSSSWEGFPWLGVRPSSGDTARLLRNAHYLKMMGRPEMALKELEAAYQQNPRNLQVLDTLARSYEELGEFNRAQKIYQEALVLDASNQALNNNLCFSYYLSGQYDKAEACFRQALAKNPQNIMARNNLGLLLCRLGRGEEASRLWRQAEGEAASQKKMQQVMVALGVGEAEPYARSPQEAPPPVQTAALKEKEPLTPPQEAAAPRPMPATAPAPQAAAVAPAPKPKDETVAARPDQAPVPMVTAEKPAPQQRLEQPVAVKKEPAAPKAAEKPVPAPAPIKTASLTPVPAAVAAPAAPAPQAPAPEKPVAKVAPPQPQAPPVTAKTKAEPATPKPLVKAAPAAAPGKPGPSVQAAAKPQPLTMPAKPAPSAEKKAVPAAAPPAPSKEVKAQVAAAVGPAPRSLEKLAKTGIEVLNGSPVKKLARQTRTMLSQEGFRVVSIGNHFDFGAENTIIYYRQGAEETARALNAKFFPQARLQTGEKFAKNADIRVLLGKDLLTLPATAGKTLPAAEKIAAKTTGGQPEVKAAAPPPPVPAAPAQAKTPAAPPAPALRVAAAPPPPDKTPKAHLTAEELQGTAIDIRNGTRTDDLAHRARAMLAQEGFRVAHIGNHIDFGAEKTIIYYRPGAEKVARSLAARFFPNCTLEQTAKLPKNMDIKVLLGSDLFVRPEVMARLSD